MHSARDIVRDFRQRSFLARKEELLPRLSTSRSRSKTLALSRASLFSHFSKIFDERGKKKKTLLSLSFVSTQHRAMGNCLSGGEGSAKKNRPASVSCWLLLGVGKSRPTAIKKRRLFGLALVSFSRPVFPSSIALGCSRAQE